MSGAHVSTAGCGEHRAPAGLVPHGQRYPYLKDFAVRLLRGGITDYGCLLVHLWAEFDRACQPHPRPERGRIEGLAAWAVRSGIADRERAHKEFIARWSAPKEHP